MPDILTDFSSAPPPRQVLIVAHGSPADPQPQEAALMALAVRVAFWLPGWQVRGATLAAPGAIEAALAKMANPLIYPFFMAEGFFTRTTLPKRLAAAGRTGLHQLPAFGHDPALLALMAELALAAATQHDLIPADTTLLIAAHGSKVSRASATITETVAATLRATGLFAQIVTGYVEEAPFLHDAARIDGPAICLPFFALRAGHVLDDVPEALSQAGFAGPLLPPLGEAPHVARMIAATLIKHRAFADA
jgi:sirohydrochlorin ferrochelatase